MSYAQYGTESKADQCRLMEFAGVDQSARYGKGGQCGRNNTVTKAAYKISSLEVENDSLYI